jgi:hypothetical protein
MYDRRRCETREFTRRRTPGARRTHPRANYNPITIPSVPLVYLIKRTHMHLTQAAQARRPIPKHPTAADRPESHRRVASVSPQKLSHSTSTTHTQQNSPLQPTNQNHNTKKHNRTKLHRSLLPLSSLPYSPPTNQPKNTQPTSLPLPSPFNPTSQITPKTSTLNL